MAKDNEAPAAPPAPAATAKTPTWPKLVKMFRKGPKPPFAADVHPAEVKNFAAHGWHIAKE